MLTAPPRASLPSTSSAAGLGPGPSSGRVSAEPALGGTWAGPKSGRRAMEGGGGPGQEAVQRALYECRTGWVFARAAVASGGGGGGGGVGVPMLSWP
jgi:hypothetical protein